jgi:hypothetical protein
MPGPKYRKLDSARCRQGDIFRDITIIEGAQLDEEELKLVERHVPYSIVISQDCDLEHDYNNRANEQRTNNDKYLPTILLCPAYLAEQLRQGDHLKEYGLKMTAFGKDWDRLKKNQMYRYHYLPSNPDYQLPELVVDFKHSHTVPRDTFYNDFKANYVVSLEELFREDFSNRFAYFLSRIGLPEPA